MSHENEMTDAMARRQRVTEEAGEWLLRLQRSDLSKEQRAEFVDWLREAPVHVTEMLRVSQVDAALREFDGWKDIAPLDRQQQPTANVVTLETSARSNSALQDVVGPASPRGETRRDPRLRERREEPQRAPRRLRWLLPAVAAAGISALAVGVWVTNVVGWERVETGAAERRQLALADGSVVQLAPNSKLRVHLQARLREIELSRGEAFFRVARDGRPFIVETEHATVRATGTAFAVERAGEGVVVTVAEGKVVVQNAEHRAEPGVLLAAGQQVTAPNTGQVGEVRSVDAARELSWTLGHLIFDRDRVFDAVDRFNRYNKTQMRIADPTLGERRISGVFDSSDPQSFVSFLESVFSVQVEHPSANEVVVRTQP